MRELALQFLYRSYGDVELLADLLASLGGVYDVYEEGGLVKIVYDEGAVAPGELVRRVLDLGHEVMLPHVALLLERGMDEKETARRLSALPAVVAAEYTATSGRAVAVVAPGHVEEAVAAIKALFRRAEVQQVFQAPTRMSFG